MRKLTIRIEDYMYDRLNLTASENNTSINKIISLIVKNFIDQPKEINYLKELDKTLDIILKKIDLISKRQYFHFNVSSQHFANHGYLSNADLKEDKCLKEILMKDNSFND